MTNHGITFLGDDELADGQDFALVITPQGGWIFYRESAVCPEVLERSWTAYRELLAELGGGPDDGEGSQTPEDQAECAAEPEPAEIDRQRRWEHVASRGYLYAVV
jgi:hypothetical protein